MPRQYPPSNSGQHHWRRMTKVGEAWRGTVLNPLCCLVGTHRVHPTLLAPATSKLMCVRTECCLVVHTSYVQEEHLIRLLTPKISGLF
jgi:hypothetical protein